MDDNLSCLHLRDYGWANNVSALRVMGVHLYTCSDAGRKGNRRQDMHLFLYF